MRALIAFLLLSAPALAADMTPFYRMGDPIIFNVTTTATQYPISSPPGATSYRGVNACSADIRIKKVPSMSDQVTRTTGTRFLARTAEVVATSSPVFVSLIAMSAPVGECVFELQYGTGQ